ncbi:MAG: hypothetical protein WDZ35_04860 [Crocinitomicaceae bacterium]
MKTSIHILSLVILIFGNIACEKYSEGGNKKKAEQNLTNVWEIEYYFLDGVDKTDELFISNYNETFADDGTYVRFYTDGNGNEVSQTGSWTLTNNSDSVNFSGGGAYDLTPGATAVSTSSYTIFKLKKKELWYSFESSGSTHHFRMVVKEE